MQRVFSLGISTAVGVAALGFATTAVAGTLEEHGFTGYVIESDDCAGCSMPILNSEREVVEYMDHMRQVFSDGVNDEMDDADDIGIPAHLQIGDDDDGQVIFIDFDAGGDPTFPVCFTGGQGLFGVFNDHVYTEHERQTITARIRQDYADFDYTFVTERPASGEYSTLSIGQNDAPHDCSQGSNIRVNPSSGGFSILFGRASGIDFLNRNKSDNAFADASFWQFAAQLDPSGGFFEAVSGLTVADFGSLEAAVAEAVVNQSANTGAHEIGHIQGLRHQNSLGAPGEGLPPTGPVTPFRFVPVFDGPSNGSETFLHTMASGASVGLGLGGSTTTDRFFSERSATRIAIAEEGRVIDEADVRRLGNDRIQLEELDVPNTILIGQNANAEFETDALVVRGELSAVGEIDRYRFSGRGGDFLNAELISVVGESLSFAEGIMGQLRLYKVEADGSLTMIASNLQSFESLFDAEIFDATLPEDGDYVIEVSAPDEFFPADFDGDGVLDPVALTAAGAGSLLQGRYSLQLYACNKDLDDDDEEDDDDDEEDDD